MSLVCSRKTSPASRGGISTALTCQGRPRPPCVCGCPPALALTELIEMCVCPVRSRHGADEPSLQEGGPLVHQAALPTHVILPGEGGLRCQQQQGDTHGHPWPPARPPADALTRQIWPMRAKLVLPSPCCRSTAVSRKKK